MTVLARKKMRGCIWKNFGRMALPAVLFCLAVTVAVPAALCLVYGTGAVLAYAGLPGLTGRLSGVAIPTALLAATGVLLLFTAAFAFYAKAWIYFAMDKNQTRPKSLLRPSQAWRYLRCRAGTLCRKAAWGVCYLLPGAGLFFALRYFAGRPWLTGAVCGVLVSADALFFLVGAAFAAVASSRYYLAEYLLYLNPLMPPREAVASSVKLTKDRLLAVTARRLSLLPWALTELLVLPLPFAAVYRRFCAAALCEILFGEDKRRAPAPAAVFYVNRRSKIVEAESS